MTVKFSYSSENIMFRNTFFFVSLGTDKPLEVVLIHQAKSRLVLSDSDSRKSETVSASRQKLKPHPEIGLNNCSVVLNWPWNNASCLNCKCYLVLWEKKLSVQNQYTAIQAALRNQGGNSPAGRANLKPGKLPSSSCRPRISHFLLMFNN